MLTGRQGWMMGGGTLNNYIFLSAFLSKHSMSIILVQRLCTIATGPESLEDYFKKGALLGQKRH